MRRLGVAICAAYVLIGLLSLRLGLVRELPLLDGLAPPAPYRWAKPPAERARDNERPLRGEGEVVFDNGESKPASIGTGDGQATVVFPFKAIAPVEGASTVRVQISPADARRFAAPPEGLGFDGNAYTVTAAYVGSDVPLVLQGQPNLILRYATHATTLLRLEPTRRWGRVRAAQYPGSLQLVATVERLGTYAAAGQPTDRLPVPGWVSLAGGAILFVAVGGLLLTGRLRARRESRSNRGGRRRAARSARRR